MPNEALPGSTAELSDEEAAAKTVLNNEQQEANNNESNDLVTDPPEDTVIDNEPKESDAPVDQPEPTKSKRQLALDAIAEESREERENVTVDDGEDSAGADKKTAEFAAAAEAAEEVLKEKAAGTGDHRIEKNSDGVECAVLKINGTEVLRPLKEVFASEQKRGAADSQLEKASTTLKELQKWNDNLAEKEATLNKGLQELNEKVTESQPQLSDEDAGKVKNAMTSFVESLVDDDIDTAVEHLQSAMGRGNATPLNEDSVRNMVADFVTQQSQIDNQKADELKSDQQEQESWSSAKQEFMTEFPEIKEGTELWKHASQETNAIANDPDFKGKSYSEIFREAGTRARKFVQELVPPTDRNARKFASHRHVATRGGEVQSRAAADPAPKTQTDLIADMKRRRRPTQNF
jgi:hypothetical protein